MAKKLRPVTVWGIEFDALIDEKKTLSSTIPVYPVEEGFPVADTIINEPVSIELLLYVSNTPVTWLYRHGTSADRVAKICNQIEQKWLEKKLTKIVTSDVIYTDMGITGISIRKSKEIGYAREITVTAQKVRITKRKAVSIPSYVLKSGDTNANAGKASTSNLSSKTGGAGSGNSYGDRSGYSGSSGGSNSGGSSSSGSKSSSGTKSSSGSSAAKKSQSILYGAASKLKFI